MEKGESVKTHVEAAKVESSKLVPEPAPAADKTVSLDKNSNETASEPNETVDSKTCGIQDIICRYHYIDLSMPQVSENCPKALKGKISHSMDLFTPSSPGCLPTLSLTTDSSRFPWGRVALPLISPLMPVYYYDNKNPKKTGSTTGSASKMWSGNLQKLKVARVGSEGVVGPCNISLAVVLIR